MLIDTHCHIDMLESPEAYLRKQEQDGGITIGMTNLPSHFEMGYSHFKNLKYSRLALGYHPLMVASNPNELSLFKKNLSETSYIGEIGLDFSREGIGSKEKQVSLLRKILECISGERKIVSVHSRRAERELYGLLREYDIKNVIFHWYSGPLGLINEIEAAGYYFSVNEMMVSSQKGHAIIEKMTRSRILTESDAPYNEKNNIVATLRQLLISEEQVKANFYKLLDGLK